jgi:hypothetical protein
MRPGIHETKMTVLTIFFEIQTTVGPIGKVGPENRLEYSPLCNDHGNIAPYVKTSIGVGGGYLDTSVLETLFERFSKDRMIRSVVCCQK